MPYQIVSLTRENRDAWLPFALDIYVLAMNYPPGTQERRAPVWHEHSRIDGWSAVGIFYTDNTTPGITSTEIDYQLLRGIAYGYPGKKDQWWNTQLHRSLSKQGCSNDEIFRLTTNYFELTEIHVHPESQGNNLGEILLRALVASRPESSILLSTPEVPKENNRAWKLYNRLGFSSVVRNFTFTGDPREFAILHHQLPLN